MQTIFLSLCKIKTILNLKVYLKYSKTPFLYVCLDQYAGSFKSLYRNWIKHGKLRDIPRSVK